MMKFKCRTTGWRAILVNGNSIPHDKFVPLDEGDEITLVRTSHIFLKYKVVARAACVPMTFMSKDVADAPCHFEQERGPSAPLEIPRSPAEEVKAPSSINPQTASSFRCPWVLQAHRDSTVDNQLQNIMDKEGIFTIDVEGPLYNGLFQVDRYKWERVLGHHVLGMKRWIGFVQVPNLQRRDVVVPMEIMNPQVGHAVLVNGKPI
ncbi:hypothetical protein As57867_006437, partial [Aphanomyces stellatus]